MMLAMALSMVSFSMQSCGRKDIIEEDDLAHIYAEMLMTDQWINSTPGIRLIADTSLVYEPILKKYGYTSAEYRNSVEYYLEDPDEYADIMTMTINILDNRLASLRERKVLLQEEKELQDFVKKVASDIRMDETWDYVSRLSDERYGMIDSLSVDWDSLSYYYRMVSVPWSERPDTLQVVDSLAVLDSLPAADSLRLMDSLHVQDSLPSFDTIKKLDLHIENKSEEIKALSKSFFKKNVSKSLTDSLSKVK